MATKVKPEKKQHIQVFMRVRPLIAQELRSQIVVECINSKEVSVKDKNQIKTFSFDRVFGPDSKQIDIYKAVVGPLIAEVLQGYNCTVFAYGQTGTGKTFTMVGEKQDASNGNWEEDPGCGMIPRTLSNLFDELKVRADEFTVRVSFLELYNEELCDLLVPIDNDDPKNLKLFEDSMKKGSVIVAGLEEKTVLNKDDVYAILEAGNLKRQTAPTLMNAQSSRSHTIFTITVHIKVTNSEGEDMIKTGKLNLVDLAGSENIGRSGAVEMRAREAGSINQSLLTLGRVITALVERKPHIPYRESKLTRILQDSLGGRTKTSIIATVSPALCNIEETLSTFDYANRAKNITNKPEINQKTSKRVLLKEYTEEIERLRRDLIATREKHGVYLASENYNAIMAERENLNKELISKLQMLKVREDELIKQEDIMKNLNMNLYATQNELAVTSQKLEEATKLCSEKEDILNELGMQTNVLIKTADEAVNDAKTLHERLAKSRQLLEHNFFSAEKFKNNFCWNLNNMKTRTKEFQTKCIGEVDNQIQSDKKFLAGLVNNQTELKDLTNKIVKETGDHIESTLEIIKNQTSSHATFLCDQLIALKSAIDAHNQKAHQIISTLFDFSLKMKSKSENLFEYLEKSRSTLEKFKIDCESFEERLAELTKLTLLLAALYTEKIKQREEALKIYQDKYSLLESKQMSLKKNLLDCGRAFFNMAQENLELLQKENECEEVLKATRNDKENKYDIIFKDIKEISEQYAFEIQNNLEEMGKMKEKLLEAMTECLKNSKENILPTAKSILSIDRNCFDLIKNLTDESPEIETKFNSVQESYESESKKMMQTAQNIENKARNIIINLKVLDSDVESKTNSQKLFIEDNFQESTMRQQTLSLKISEHAEELCSCIFERLKEIETFFSEDVKKEEKTGNTPHKKEFNHSRRFMGFLKKGKLEDSLAKKKLLDTTVESLNEGSSTLE